MGGRWLGGFDRMLRAPLLSPFVSQDLRSVTASENAEDMVVLKDMIEAGQVTPVIERSYALAEVPDAIRHIEAGRARGKVVITI
jgi:NADPH:quinone reductase-like Zn-dependent oxidoreductase